VQAFMLSSLKVIILIFSSKLLITQAALTGLSFGLTIIGALLKINIQHNLTEAPNI
jgi:hypothetical protein